MKTLALLAPGLLLAAAACGSGDREAVPRRKAFPRLAFSADSIGRPASLDGVSFRINRIAGFRPDSARPDWADIVYPPALGSTMYLSISRPADLPGAVANRRERISLNLGDAPALTEEFHAGRWACTLVSSTRAGLTTPVQLLATSSDGRLLSGAVALDAPGESADSIRPLLDLLRDDARTLLLSLE